MTGPVRYGVDRRRLVGQPLRTCSGVNGGGWMVKEQRRPLLFRVDGFPSTRVKEDGSPHVQVGDQRPKSGKSPKPRKQLVTDVPGRRVCQPMLQVGKGLMEGDVVREGHAMEGARTLEAAPRESQQFAETMEDWGGRSVPVQEERAKVGRELDSFVAEPDLLLSVPN